jgi:hypothetical protein
LYLAGVAHFLHGDSTKWLYTKQKHHKHLSLKYLRESLEIDPSSRDCQSYLSLVHLSLSKPQLAILAEGSPLVNPMQRAVQAIAYLSQCKINEAYNVVRQDSNDEVLLTLIKAKIEQVHHRMRT